MYANCCDTLIYSRYILGSVRCRLYVTANDSADSADSADSGDVGGLRETCENEQNDDPDKACHPVSSSSSCYSVKITFTCFNLLTIIYIYIY